MFDEQQQDPEVSKDVFSRAFDVGSYVDVRICEGVKGIAKNFKVLENNLPTADKPLKIVKQIMTNRLYEGRDTSEDLWKLIQQVGDEVGVGGSTWSQERKDKIYTENNLLECITELKEVAESSKTPVDKTEVIVGDASFNALAEDSHTSGWIEAKDGEELIHQKELYGNILKTPCKGLIDVVRVNHNNKTIMLGDYKTTELSNITDFASRKTMIQYRLDLQADMYRNLVLLNLKNWTPSGYSLIPDFFFIVVSKKTQQVGIVKHRAGTTVIDEYGNMLPGLLDMIKRYNFHTSTNQWDHPMEYYENGGFYTFS